MENEKSEEPTVDVNCDEFYDKIQTEVETDIARLKKEVEVLKDLRITAAEMEVETAALYHAELLQNVEELEAINKKFHTDFCEETSANSNISN